jgi:hypothetical protein
METFVWAGSGKFKKKTSPASRLKSVFVIFRTKRAAYLDDFEHSGTVAEPQKLFGSGTGRQLSLTHEETHFPLPQYTFLLRILVSIKNCFRRN